MVTTFQVALGPERSYHNTKSAYILPNDTPEHDRLESQSQHIRELMGDRIIHAPLSASDVHKAVDIGCGTGIVTHEIASKFPNAQVYGLDLSPVPNIREKLQNIEYVEANIVDIAIPDEPDARFKQASFDYIFSRFLVVGMTEWEKYIARCVALAKPGAWIEMHDIDNTLHRIPDPLTPAARAALNPHSLTLSECESNSHPVDGMTFPEEWMNTHHRLCRVTGLEPECGRRLPRWFAETGLEDVRIRRYMLPMGVWDGMTEAERKWGEHYPRNIGAFMPEAMRKIGQSQTEVSQADVKAGVDGAIKVKQEYQGYRGFIFVYAVCGRKPAK